MFGLSMGEILLLVVVGIVVVGPRRLPTLMRTAGRWITKIRRMSTDLRAQSGLDDLIRQEGLEQEIRQLRSLSRVNVIDSLMSPAVSSSPYTPAATSAQTSLAAASSYGAASSVASGPRPEPPGAEPVREREYPLLGCDSFYALPDDDAACYVLEPAKDIVEEPPANGAAPASRDATAAAIAEPGDATAGSTAVEPVAAVQRVAAQGESAS